MDARYEKESVVCIKREKSIARAGWRSLEICACDKTKCELPYNTVTLTLASQAVAASPGISGAAVRPSGQAATSGYHAAPLILAYSNALLSG